MNSGKNIVYKIFPCQQIQHMVLNQNSTYRVSAGAPTSVCLRVKSMQRLICTTASVSFYYYNRAVALCVKSDAESISNGNGPPSSFDRQLQTDWAVTERLITNFTETNGAIFTVMKIVGNVASASHSINTFTIHLISVSSLCAHSSTTPYKSFYQLNKAYNKRLVFREQF